jgi:hypothetical protein
MENWLLSDSDQRLEIEYRIHNFYSLLPPPPSHPQLQNNVRAPEVVQHGSAVQEPTVNTARHLQGPIFWLFLLQFFHLFCRHQADVRLRGVMCSDHSTS